MDSNPVPHPVIGNTVLRLVHVARVLYLQVPSGWTPGGSCPPQPPCVPSLPGTATPYTATSVWPSRRLSTASTSVVDTFSPRQRKVSPLRSRKYM